MYLGHAILSVYCILLCWTTWGRLRHLLAGYKPNCETISTKLCSITRKCISEFCRLVATTMSDQWLCCLLKYLLIILSHTLLLHAVSGDLWPCVRCIGNPVLMSVQILACAVWFFLGDSAVGLLPPWGIYCHFRQIILRIGTVRTECKCVHVLPVFRELSQSILTHLSSCIIIVRQKFYTEYIDSAITVNVAEDKVIWDS